MMQRMDSIREQFLTNLEVLQRRMANTQLQISSGYRISKPSDDPGAVTDVLHLEFDSSRVTQTLSNLAAVKSEVDTAEAGLQTVGSLLDQARTLGAQGATDPQTAAARATLAVQVDQILSQIVSVSRTTYQGQYVFSGDQTNSPAYSYDATAGVTRLLTPASTRVVQDANGVQFSVSLTANSIFDHRDSNDVPDASNVFAALDGLRKALRNNDVPAINTALDSLKTAQTYFESQHAFYGATQNRISNSIDQAQQYQDQYTASLHDLKDTDIAAAATQMTQDNLSQQAAMQAQANLPHGSLFDYIK
jgi:flagellar hook-associated protein 3 FlgL